MIIDYPNWFEHKSEDYFTQHLQDFKDKDNLKFLQIGVFTGDGSIWLLNNLLTGQSCTLTDVDRWELDASANQESHDWFADVEATYDAKTEAYTNIIKYKMDSTTFFAQNSDSFDFIYLDGDKSEDGVYADAMAAWQTLKPDGLFVRDDMDFCVPDQNWNAAPGIVAFLAAINGQYTVINQTDQHLLIKKKA
jgi:predicted O-methyltransferase YrrM